MMRFDRSRYTPRSIAVRCAVIIAGVMITSLGAACYVLAALGSDPVTAFVQGIGYLLHLDFGQSMNIFNAFFFVVVLLCYRKVIGIGTVLYTFTLGFFCNGSIRLIGLFANADSALWIRILLIAAGTAAIAVGLGIYQSAEFGTGPSDGFNQAMAHYSGLPLKYERVIFDVLMVLGSVLMGGLKLGFVHFGTLVGMFGVGPVMAPVMTKLSPLVNRWSGSSADENGNRSS